MNLCRKYEQEHNVKCPHIFKTSTQLIIIPFMKFKWIQIEIYPVKLGPSTLFLFVASVIVIFIFYCCNATVSFHGQYAHLTFWIKCKTYLQYQRSSRFATRQKYKDDMSYNKLHTEVLFSLEKVEGRAGVKRMHRRDVNSKFQKMVESYLKLRTI